MSAHLMHSSNKATRLRKPTNCGPRPFAVTWATTVRSSSTIAGGTVTHIVEGSSNPSWVGTKQLRYFELSADNAQLTLSLRDGARTTQSLVWKRSRS